ncbi:MAG: AMP-binding protein [Pirellulales bacterium]
MPGDSNPSGRRDLLTLSDLLQRRAHEYADRAALVFHESPGQNQKDGINNKDVEKGGHAGRSRGSMDKSHPAKSKAGLSTATLIALEAQTGLVPVGWTYSDLERRARRIGAWLSQHAKVGDRALLVYVPGLEFSAAFFGCLYAGVLPVPATYPKPRRPLPRLANMALDCQPKLVLTSRATFQMISLETQSTALREIPWQSTDALPPMTHAATWQPLDRQPDDLAFLQYTSGSTTEPRGVMITHRNLLHNLEMIRQGFDIPPAGSTDENTSSVFWLPAYHDMGLIGGILSPLYVGGTSHLLAPSTFLRRPLAWLEVLSATRATISGAPNFAYDLCVSKTKLSQRSAIDLNCWRLAFCGAEPIQADTLQKFADTYGPAGFQADTFYPCYGLAEATLLVSGNQGPSRLRVLQVDRAALTQGRAELTESALKGPMPGDPALDRPARADYQTLVGCGSSLDEGGVQIVDPHTCRPHGEGQVGEIWVRGDAVAQGYWCKEELSEETFAARLADEKEAIYLRTGDLGFQLDGQLYVTGRLKDLLILRGRNHYPQDLERTAQQSHVAVDQSAAFTWAGSVGEEGEVESGHPQERLVVVHQIQRESRRADLDEVIRAIRRAIVEEHELDPHAIVLIRPASLPFTSSGKVQRSRCRELYVRGELKVMAQWQKKSALQDSQIQDDTLAENAQPVRPDFTELAQSGDPKQLAHAIENWMLTWLAAWANLEQIEVNPATPFAELGVDSMTAIELSQELEEALTLKIPPVAALEYPTPATLAQYLAEQYLS